MSEVPPEVRKNVHHLFCQMWAAKGIERTTFDRYAARAREDHRWEYDQRSLEETWLRYVDARQRRMDAGAAFIAALVESGLPYWAAYSAEG